MRIIETCARKTRNRLSLNRILRMSLYLLLFFSLASLPVILLKQFRIIDFNTKLIPVLFVLLEAGIVFYTIYSRKSLRGCVALFDNTYGMKARLISAWDQMEKGWTSSYADLIREDLKKNIGRPNFRKLFPFKHPRFTPLLPFLLAITISLLIFQIPVYWFRSIDPVISGQASELEEMARKLIQENQDNPDPGNLELAEEIERLASEFREMPLAREEAVEQLGRLAKKIEDKAKKARQQMMMEGELASDIMKETGEALDMMDQNMMDPQDINDLERHIMESDEISDGMKETLKDKFDDFKKNPNPNAQEDLADDIREEMTENSDKQRDGQDTLDKQAEKLNEMGESMARGDMKEESAGTSSSKAMDEPGSENGGKESADKQSNNIAGTEDTPDTDSSFEHIRPETMEQDKLENKITSKEVVENQVKSIPKISEKKINAADLDIRYKQAVENNILKEEIPVSMREYIKDYFIGIGVLDEDSTGND